MVEWTADPGIIAPVSVVDAAARDGAVVRHSAVADGERARPDATTARVPGPRLRRWRSVGRARIRSSVARLAMISRARGEAGMSTAEYAVGTIAACGFAALLWKVLSSAEVRSMLAALVQKALKLAG